MKKIVSFIGVIGSGKDYASKKLLEENPGAKILGFSDGVREFTWAFLGWRPKDEEEYEYFKANKVMVLNGIDWLSVHNLTGRQMLENIAEHMRSIDPEYWGKYWFERAKTLLATTDTLIVPDCRRDEEARKIINLASHLNIDRSFHFTNYKSHRYEIRDHISEKFAQHFLNEGYAHGEKINKAVHLKVYG